MIFLPVLNTNNRMRLLLGSPILHNLELQLINAIYNPQNNPATAHVPLLFTTLLNNIKRYYNNNNENVIILVDMSPSASVFNQHILLSSDYFMIPCTPDDNSVISLGLLFHYMDNWRNTHNYLNVNHNVKFLFTIYNRYKVSAGGISNACLTLRNSIVQKTQNFVQNHQQFVLNLNNNIILISIQNSMRFAEICSDENISIFELTNKHCSNHNTGMDFTKVNSVQNEYINIYTILINNNIVT